MYVIVLFIIRKTKNPFLKNETGKSGRKEGKNESGQFPDTHTKKEQRLNVLKTVFKRCFFIAKIQKKTLSIQGNFVSLHSVRKVVNPYNFLS